MPRPFRLPWQTKEEHERDVAIWEHHMDEYASGLDRVLDEETEEEDYGDPEGGTQEDSDD